MYIVDVIKEWIELNKETLTDIPNDKKFSKIDITDLLDNFSYNDDIYSIASRLFQELYSLTLLECVTSELSYEVFENEIYRLAEFCCLREYGRELTKDYFLEIVKWNEARSLLNGLDGVS